MWAILQPLINCLIAYITKHNLYNDFKDYIMKLDCTKKDKLIKRVFKVKTDVDNGQNYWNISPEVFSGDSINAVTAKMWSTFIHPEED
jgi:hypothetical protein